MAGPTKGLADTCSYDCAFLIPVAIGLYWRTLPIDTILAQIDGKIALLRDDPDTPRRRRTQKSRIKPQSR